MVGVEGLIHGRPLPIPRELPAAPPLGVTCQASDERAELKKKEFLGPKASASGGWRSRTVERRDVEVAHEYGADPHVLALIDVLVVVVSHKLRGCPDLLQVDRVFFTTALVFLCGVL